VQPDATTLAILLKLCGDTQQLEKGREIHNLAKRTNMLMLVAAPLITMYSSCGDLASALSIFNDTQPRTLTIWNSMISTYVQHNQHQQATQLLYQMKKDGLQPDQTTYSIILKSCVGANDLARGKLIHDLITQNRLYTTITATALLSMYGRCGDLPSAIQVFQQMPKKDTIAWDAMMSACLQNDDAKSALKFFLEMQQSGEMLSEVSFTNICKACGQIRDLNLANQIHTQVIASGLPLTPSLLSSLLSMYAKCGELQSTLFEQLRSHKQLDLAGWNALIAACTQTQQYEQALELYKEMKARKIRPDSFTLSLILTSTYAIRYF
jgi:pentatricopeptide repeat protein